MNWLLSIALLFLAATAHAQEANPYGAKARLSDKGRLLIAGQLGGWWENHRNWHVNINPSVSYFVTDRIGVGGFFGYRNERGDYDVRKRAYTLGVQSTNEVVRGERTGLWLLANFGYTRRDDTVPQLNLSGILPPELIESLGRQELRSPFQPIRNWLRVGMSLAFVYQLNSHVGLGIGPDVGFTFAPAAEHVEVLLGMSTWIPVSI